MEKGWGAELLSGNSVVDKIRKALWDLAVIYSATPLESCTSAQVNQIPGPRLF